MKKKDIMTHIEEALELAQSTMIRVEDITLNPEDYEELKTILLVELGIKGEIARYKGHTVLVDALVPKGKIKL